LLAGDYLGSSVSTVGDLNNDGKDDLLVGARFASPGNRLYAGTVYVIFGKVSWPANFDLTTLNGKNGFVIEGLASGDQLGTSVSTAGDFNGDGKEDLVLGASGAFEIAGAAYVILNLNGPPILVHTIPDQTIEVGTAFNFTIASDTFVDITGDNLTYSAQQINGSPLPSWVSFDTQTLCFSGMASLAGNTPLMVEATNTGNLSTHANFSLLTSTPSNSLGAMVGGIIGGVVALGVAGATYLAYKKGFFASFGRGKNDHRRNYEELKTPDISTVSLDGPDIPTVSLDEDTE
jgi:hypothetical protein